MATEPHRLLTEQKCQLLTLINLCLLFCLLASTELDIFNFAFTKKSQMFPPTSHQSEIFHSLNISFIHVIVVQDDASTRSL